MMNIFQGFWTCPPWVDQSKPAGWTPYPDHEYGKKATWNSISSPFTLFFRSPNMSWCLVAVATYMIFPYTWDEKIRGRDVWSVEWLSVRFALCLTLTLVYNGIWGWILFWIPGYGSRSFSNGGQVTESVVVREKGTHIEPQAIKGIVSKRTGGQVVKDVVHQEKGTNIISQAVKGTISVSNVIHNLWYCILAVAQWVVWEAVFVRLYATGKLDFVPDAEIFASPKNVIVALMWCIFLPTWRSFHFYVAHRFLHCGPLYKYVHSVHHRNVNIEPFSGVAMHPVEHLYYFTSFAPLLLINSSASPFHLWQIGVHLLISPGASHSGFEDHYGSDQFHNTHHRFFECNYGDTTFAFDMLFGTHRLSSAPKTTRRDPSMEHEQSDTTTPSSSSSSSSSSPQLAPTIVKNTKAKLGFPTIQNATYDILNVGIFFLFLVNCVDDPGKSLPWLILSPASVAWIVSVGPVVISFVLGALVCRSKQSLVWPFHKASRAVVMFHWALAVIFILFPVYFPIRCLADVVNEEQNY